MLNIQNLLGLIWLHRVIYNASNTACLLIELNAFLKSIASAATGLLLFCNAC